ncbi:hypothetical protein [Ulvibacterium sp.]|uniref:hypothetical protein n=1 Tax=Ulvibacterium sp. TaxID=2665914 RepID=UPI003BAA6A25
MILKALIGDKAYHLFDEANRNDSHGEIYEERFYPMELRYAIRMTETFNEFASAQ